MLTADDDCLILTLNTHGNYQWRWVLHHRLSENGDRSFQTTQSDYFKMNTNERCDAFY